MAWGFYGRRSELGQLKEIFDRGRWFFCKITGRRRIGKTTLIHEALRASGRQAVFYVQIPDSGPAGVLSSVGDAMETIGIDVTRFPPPKSLRDLARLVGLLARAGFVVALDEFQYFHRAALTEFCSHLQAEVDLLGRDASEVAGGLVVLGSLHTEMEALLEHRDAPLFHRVTHEIDVTHLDVASVCEILRAHSEFTPERLLFLWTLFEGVPKFYRDCFEQDVLAAPRKVLLRRMFFDSSSPLRSEADNWFLKEFHGRYDVVLKYVARNPGCDHADILAHVKDLSGEGGGQVGGYIKILIERFRVIERRLPIFSTPRTRRGRYHIADNFLRTWLSALASPVSQINFKPVEDLVDDADRRLAETEGRGLEDLVSDLYEERSRKGIGEFRLSRRIDGYWNSKDTEIDLVALDESSGVVRFGFCRRSEDRLLSGVTEGDGHVTRFLAQAARSLPAKRVIVGMAPSIGAPIRKRLAEAGWSAEDLSDLLRGL